MTITCGLPQYTVEVVAIGTINVTTNNAGATFTVTGPSVYAGSGTSWSQVNAPIGVYSIVFAAIGGQVTPTDTSKTLIIGGSITFTGTYVPSTGSVSFSTTPAGARIFIGDPSVDQGAINVTPYIVTSLVPGTYPYQLTLPGYVTLSGTADVTSGIQTNKVLTFLTPASIVAQSITVTPSSPCIEGTCSVFVSVTWINSGQTAGSSNLTITVSGGTSTITPPSYSSVAFAAGQIITETFTVTGLDAAHSPHSICPSPNT